VREPAAGAQVTDSGANDRAGDLPRLNEENGVITATEAEYAGPWATASMPGRPGEVGVVRALENEPELAAVPRAPGHGTVSAVTAP
jgi:hypothetical protein